MILICLCTQLHLGWHELERYPEVTSWRVLVLIIVGGYAPGVAIVLLFAILRIID
jgi:hypothetical protein